MALVRHVQIYLALGVSHNRHIKKYVPSPPVSYKAEKQAEWLDDWTANKSYGLLHCVQLERLEAAVFDFESTEAETLYANPGTQKPVRISLRRSDGIACGPAFFKELHSLVSVRGFANLWASNISYRSENDSFDRHLLRIEAMKNRGGAVLKKINPILFLKLSSFGWRSVLGPDSICDQSAMIDQLDIRGVQIDLVKQSLQTTLNVFERMGVCPLVQI